jgi:hypothetical protein
MQSELEERIFDDYKKINSVCSILKSLGVNGEALINNNDRLLKKYAHLYFNITDLKGKRRRSIRILACKQELSIRKGMYYFEIIKTQLKKKDIIITTFAYRRGKDAVNILTNQYSNSQNAVSAPWS